MKANELMEGAEFLDQGRRWIVLGRTRTRMFAVDLLNRIVTSISVQATVQPTGFRNERLVEEIGKARAKLRVGEEIVIDGHRFVVKRLLRNGEVALAGKDRLRRPTAKGDSLLWFIDKVPAECLATSTCDHKRVQRLWEAKRNAESSVDELLRGSGGSG